MSDGEGRVRLKLDEGSDAVIERGGVTVTFNASGLVVNVRGATITVDNDGTVAMQAAAENASETIATLEVGAVALGGDHKGEIYGGEDPTDNRPVWFSEAPEIMDHYSAAAWAAGQGGALPTREQGEYLTTLNGKGGAFTELFNRGDSFPAGYIWLAERSPNNSTNAWCQRLSDGDQCYDGRYVEQPVLCVKK